MRFFLPGADVPFQYLRRVGSSLVLLLLVLTLGCGEDIEVQLESAPDATFDASVSDAEILDSGMRDTRDTNEPDTEHPDAASADLSYTPDADPPAPPTFSTYFNYPPDADTPDDQLEELLLDLLAEAPPGSEVRAAFFTWSRTRMARAFGDALDRGVDVEVVVGNTNRHPDGRDWQAIGILKDRLGDRLTICDEGGDNGCIGTGIQHNKFVLFSSLEDGSQDVVFQSSANLTNPQRTAFNNVVVIRGDTTLYDAYRAYWTDLKAQQRDLDYYRSTVGDLRTKAYFFPRDGGDTVVNILGNVHCDQGATIRIAMAFFTNVRVAIADRLRQMAMDGCDIGLVLRDAPEYNSVGGEVRSALTHPDIDLAVFGVNDHPSVHSKYLIIDGAYGAQATEQKLVWTGSHNYTGPALTRNDETLLKIRDEAVMQAYMTDWQTLRIAAP